MDLSKFTAPVILLGLVAGMFFPFFKFFAPALTIIIGIVIFSACLSVDTKSVAETIRKPKYYGVLFFVLFILQPLATWLVARIFVQNPLILAGIVLISAAPPPAGLGFWIHSLKSNVSLALAFISISYIVTPLVIPILAYYLLGSYVHVDVFGIARSLVFIIIIPLALALLLQRFKDVKKYTNVIALPAFFLLIATTIALNASTIFTNTAILLLISLFVLFQCLLSFGASFLLSMGWDWKDREPLLLGTATRNNVLLMAVAMTGFGDLAALPGAIAIVIQLFLVAVYLHFKK